MHPITVSQGPTVSRGLLSILGIGMDLGGPGAARWNASFADPYDPDGTRWLGGYTPVSIPCGRITGLLPGEDCGPGPSFVTVGEGEDASALDQSTPPWAIGDVQYPFEVLGPRIECSTLGLGGAEDPEALAMSSGALEDLLWRAVARELWTGELADLQGWANNRRLAGPDTIILGEGLSLPYALSLLERAVTHASSRDERAVIHTPFEMLTFFAGESILVSTPNSDRFWTPGGSAIAADVGYPGTSPGGTYPAVDENGQQLVWLYATTRLSARLGEPYSMVGAAPMSNGKAITVATNDVALQHRQPAAITFPCEVYGVSVLIGP